MEETAQGRALFEELLWVHGMVRRDLDTVRRLAGEVAGGMGAEALGQELAELQANGPLWQLKVNCLRYCRFVHGHHGAEDALLFPELRRADPTIAPVVDKLERDHRRVSDLLDAVEDAARALTQATADARARVTAALEELAAHLLEHLDYEELQVGPALRRLEWSPRP